MMCDYRNGGRLRYLPVPNSPPVSILHDPASLTPISCGCACWLIRACARRWH